MQKKYEVPELNLIGEAPEVIMGSGCGGDDMPWETALDFEFEQD